MNTIGFSNFKAFGEKIQSFDRKPITLVYGANSVGKSTLLHRELYMQYVLDKKKVNVNKTTMFGDEIDFGGFDRFVHGRNPKNEICLHLSTDGFKNQYEDFAWKHFYNYTPEMQASLVEKIDALSEQECKRRMLDLPAIKNEFNTYTEYLNTAQLNNREIRSYTDIGTKIFDPNGDFGGEMSFLYLLNHELGEDYRYIKLSAPVLNPYYMKEASLLLNREITLDDCKSFEFNVWIYEKLKHISLSIIAKNDSNKEKALLAQKFLDMKVRPEWMCLTKFPLLPLLPEGYRTDNVYKTVDNIIYEKNKAMKESHTHKTNEAFNDLARNIYTVLFSNGYNNELYDTIYDCICAAQLDNPLDNLIELSERHWNRLDTNTREVALSEKVTTTYKEYLLNHIKQMFGEINKRKNFELDIYIGKIDQGDEVGITRIEISLKHQKYFTAVYLADGEIEYEFNQDHSEVHKQIQSLIKTMSLQDSDNTPYHDEYEILSNKRTIKINSKFWLNDYEKDREYSYLLVILGKVVDSLLSEIQQETIYIGPLRDYPSREDAFIVNDEVAKNNIMLQLRNNPKTREIVNSWFESNDKLRLPYRVKERKLIDINELYEKEEHFSNISGSKDKKEMMRYMLENFEGLSEITFVDTRTNTPVHNRDMGLGVTQILPIIIATNTNNNAQIIIEQPELHLHPALQCELADEFIHSYKKNSNSFLIESHSEHLLLRIMKRMRHTAEDKQDRDKSLDLTPDDVCLLYVDNNGKTSYINELELDDDGSLLDPWPKGFFEDGHIERFE